MPRLFLLDGTALAYRSHYALARSGLTRPDGRPTGAVWGFTQTLRRILENESPDGVVVALDAPGPTFRHERYEAYKATRERAPEELLDQLEAIREIVRAHGIPILEIPGYEADDVIGTLARRAEEQGFEVLIVTGDKDFMQLVSERVRLYNVFRQDEDVVLQGPDEVRAKFGTDPDHVVDVLAIMGDSSDNVPGVRGIGEKGAIALIERFGSVSGVLEHVDELSPKQREKIEANRDELLLSLELVRIDVDVPLGLSLDDLPPPCPDRKRLVELFRELDFQTLVKKVVEAPGERAGERDFVIVRDGTALESMLAELRAAGAFALDTETTGLAPLEAELVGVSFSAREGRAFYVPFNANPAVLPGGPPALLDALRPLLVDPALRRVGQNYKYDALVLRAAAVELPAPDFDTMVASFCVAGSTRRHGLDDLALFYFEQAKIPTKELIGVGKKQITMDMVAVDSVGEYACEDAEVTWRLAQVLEREIEDVGATQLYYDLELPLVPVLAAMEWRGIRLDRSVLDELASELTEEMRAAEADVRRLAREEINVNSTKALGELFFERLRIQDQVGVKRPKKTKTGWATDHQTLSSRYGDVEIVQRLLAYREVQKLKSTYVDPLPGYVNPRTGRIHCSFSQVSAATGRLASSDPNLQNIPVRTERGRRLRAAFVARPPDARGEWCLLSADYSQVELRIMAHFSKDPQMAAAFEEGRDIHASTAAVVFDVPPERVDRQMRSRAKAINFGLLYGMGPQRLARDTGLSLQEAKDFVERYFASFPRVRAWIDGTLAAARDTGYVETLLGRRRPVPEIRSSDARTRVFAENAAVNTPIQGSAADIIKRAMIDLETRLAGSGLGAELLLQVHDELLLEVPLSELDATREVVRECMEHAVSLDVPLKVEFGHGANWLEAH